MSSLDISPVLGFSKSLEPLVAAQSLRVVIGGTSIRLVDDVDLEMQRGEIVGLVGESGSGKTTLGLALLGYCRSGLKIANGSLRIGKTDVLSMNEANRRSFRKHAVSYVPQDPATALNPALRIGRQLVEGFDQYTPTEPDLLKSLDEVHLPASAAFLARYPHELSGGQQQRVAIAMAFASRPELILLDEPTTGLDVTVQAQVLDTVRRLCSEHNTAALYVSHDLAVVSILADRVAVLYAGRIVEVGPTRSVLHNARHPYTHALTRAVPDIKSRCELKGIPGHAPNPAHRAPGCDFAPRCELVIPTCNENPIALVRARPAHEVRCLREGLVQAQAEPVTTLANSKQIDKDLVLTVRDLVAFHGANQVLSGINLKVQANSCVALVGGSGSGKTTLARCIAGLHKDFRGKLQFRKRVLAQSTRERSRTDLQEIQYVFQNPYASMNPRRSVGASLAVGLRQFASLSQADARSRIIRALDEVALPPRFADLYPHQMSGGQRQRAAIARALIVEPKLLVCDEITSALDVSVQALVVELLQKLQKDRGLSLLFITHNIALVASLAQTIVVMQRGSIVEGGDTEALLSHPTTVETRQLLQNVPSFAAVPQ